MNCYNEELDNVLSELNKVTNTLKTFEITKETYNNYAKAFEKKIENNENYIKVIQTSREFYRKAIDIIYEKSVGQLSETLNSALNYIFYDRDYSLELKLEDKRGKSLELVLRDGENEINLKDGVGMGVRTVISAVLQTYYLMAKGSKVLFVDEKYSYVSESYVQRFFDFLKSLCHKSGFALVIISHDTRFFDYADKVIVVNEGRVNEKE